MGNLSPIFAADSPKFELGDKVSIFSDKAYRKNAGKYFEAVGNVVIISEKDTIYGELASFDQDSMMIKVEGNVRIISTDMTVYGSHLDYNLTSGVAHIKNARIMTTDFNLISSYLTRLSEKEYVADEAEFSTCKDCPESWSVYGEEIKVFVGEYLHVKHALAKIKGVDVLYFPYLVLPIMTKRKTGLLFPKISSRLGEGLAYEQPVFVALGDSKDMTLSPTFWATRGYGGDFQYRQRMDHLSWFEMNARMLNDTIYRPGESSEGEKEGEFFRYFVEAETHKQWTSNLSSHLRYTGTRDLDIVRDHPQFTDLRNMSSDFGFTGFVDWRKDYFSLGVESQYLRNQLFSDPMEFDRTYVQVLPRVYFSSLPWTVLQSDIPFFENMTLGFDSSYARFRQVDILEDEYLRNVDRGSIRPYLMWHFFSKGPFSLRSDIYFDQQYYDFVDRAEPYAGKNATVFQTEFSFTMDRIFGLAYEEKIPVKYLSEEALKKLQEKKVQGLTPLQSETKEERLIGKLQEYESDLSKETISQIRSSYRHSQDFKFIHHYISSENEYGNPRFLEQLRSRQRGAYLDYEDNIRSNEYLSGSLVTRTSIPQWNTLEFQWNHTLIRKTPKRFSFLDDQKYLQDNFTYSRLGFFYISQGYLIDSVVEEETNQRLTRLLLSAGFTANRWTLNFSEAYFHYVNENIFNLNLNRHFDYLNLLASYGHSSFRESEINNLSFGGQVRPTDIIGFAMLKEIDLEAKQEVRSLYSLDIMPNNNCWILNFNFRESIVDSRFFFNIVFNFGDESFHELRRNYFAVKRL